MDCDLHQKLQAAYSGEAFREEGHRLVDLLADYLAANTKGDATQAIPYRAPDKAWEYWSSRGPSPSVVDLARDVMAQSVRLHHPHYVGHQINPALPVTALAALLVDLLNNGMGVYEMGMAGTAIERYVVREVATRLGMPDDADGFLTSGGSLANLTALLAARAHQASHDVWQEGNRGPLAILVSDAAHYCVDRAVRIMGLGQLGVQVIPTNAQFQLRTDLLEPARRRLVDQGVTVLGVVGSACSTSTGSFDDLTAIADFCERHQLWFHADAVHGGALAFSDKYRSRLAGIERADSVAIDFHKMLMTPTLCSALIFRRGGQSYRTFSQQADYLFAQSSEPEWFNLARRTFECTKNMMGFKFYCILKTHGPELLALHVEYLCELAQTFADQIRQRTNLELAMQPQANIVCFRYVGATRDEQEIDRLNKIIREKMVKDGKYYLVQTTLRGAIWLRTTLSNPFTTPDHLQGLLDELERYARES